MGQAKSDSIEAQSQVDKAMSEVKAIIDELNSLRDINVSDLDRLGMGKKITVIFTKYLIFDIQLCRSPFEIGRRRGATCQLIGSSGKFGRLEK